MEQRKAPTKRKVSGRRIPASYKNMLVYRAIQIAQLLHKTQSFKEYVVDAINMTNANKKKNGLRLIAQDGKNEIDKAINYLQETCILEKSEADYVRGVMDLRNDAAHRMHLLMVDISSPEIKDIGIFFDINAVPRFEQLMEKVKNGLNNGQHITPGNGPDVMFYRADKALNEELRRLHRRIVNLELARSTRLPLNPFAKRSLSGDSKG